MHAGVLQRHRLEAAADQRSDVLAQPNQPAQVGLPGSLLGAPEPCPDDFVVVPVGHLFGEVDEIAELRDHVSGPRARRVGLPRRQPLRVEARVVRHGRQYDHRTRLSTLKTAEVAQQLNPELLLDEADLGRAVVFGSEAELEELVADEPFRSPAVGVHVAGVPGPDAGHGPRHAGPPGGVQAHRAERAWVLDAQRPPLRARARPARELRVRTVEVEQVLALGVEDEGAHVLAFGAAPSSAIPVSVSRSW